MDTVLENTCEIGSAVQLRCSHFHFTENVKDEQINAPQKKEKKRRKNIKREKYSGQMRASGKKGYGTERVKEKNKRKGCERAQSKLREQEE